VCNGNYSNFEIFIMKLSGSWCSVWQIIVFFVLLSSYPNCDCKSNGNMLVINNVVKHVLYKCICWFYYISQIVSGFSTEGSTTAFIAGVSTNFWQRVGICCVIGILVLWITNGWQYSFVGHPLSVSFLSCHLWSVA
jgi:hypothetical protein